MRVLCCTEATQSKSLKSSDEGGGGGGGCCANERDLKLAAGLNVSRADALCKCVDRQRSLSLVPASPVP